MNQILLLFVFAFCIQAQVQVSPSRTLAQLAKKINNADPQQTRAANYLLQAHPDFAGYAVIAINSAINRTSQSYADNLRDYLFELDSNNIRVRALVTLSNLTKQSYVTISPIVTAPLQPPKGKYGPVNEYSLLSTGNNSGEGMGSPIINQSISSATQNKSISKAKVALNSYIQYNDEQDPLVQFALDYIASVHPNIINYKLTNDIYYQLVAGMNIKVHYIGYDNYSAVTAVVYFDLKLTPALLSFEVDCVNVNQTCNPLQAWDIYQSVQWILIYYPQLFAYQLTDINVLHGLSADEKMRAMLTFQNSHDKLRYLFQVEITLTQASVLSYYSYSYQQS